MTQASDSARDAEIKRRRYAGEWPHEIAENMRISRNVVAGVLNRAGLRQKTQFTEREIWLGVPERLRSERAQRSAATRRTRKESASA